jgi:hypothetical protein
MNMVPVYYKSFTIVIYDHNDIMIIIYLCPVL